MILKDIGIYDKTFKEFQKYLYYKYFNQDITLYKSFPNREERDVLIALISFLDYKKIPIFTSIIYYSYHYNDNAINKIKFAIKNEFNNLENNVKQNYCPF